MNKQDRQGARTPADLERKYNFEQSFAEVMGIATDARTTAEKAETELTKEVARIDKEISAHEASIGLLVDNGEVQGSIIIEAINDESSAKISADRLDIEGKTLNVKVDATNIEGKLISDQINADGIIAEGVDITGKVTAKKGSIGGWTIGEKLTATTEIMGAGIIQRQIVTLSAEGVEATGVFLQDPNWTGPTPTFPAGISVGQAYGPVFKTWAELLGVYDTATIEVVSDE